MKEIPHGDKTIKLSIHFFATDLPNRKMAWQEGRVGVMTNRSRGLNNNDESREMFNTLEELPSKILKVLEKNEIVLVDWEKNKSKDKKLQIIFPK